MYRWKKCHLILVVLLLFTALLADSTLAQSKAVLKQQAKSRLAGVAQDNHPPSLVLDVNNITSWLVNDGKFDWLARGGAVNGTFPKGTAGSVFAQGIVWGGIVQDGRQPSVRVNGSVYSNGLDPGKILRNPDGSVIGPDNPSDLAKYHVWRVHRRWQTLDLTQSASAYFDIPPADVTDAQRQQLREWYEYDWNNWPADMGAPFEDVDGNGAYDPATDIPGYPGADQTMWIVTNDIESSEDSYGSPPIGIEYQLTLWGYDFPSTSPLGNITFKQARLIYTGLPNTPQNAFIDSMYVVMWADPDVGSAGDDYAGSDTTLSLGYAYNANTRDTDYDNFGLAPPAVGWDFLQGPITTEGDTLGMTSFVYFAAGSDISDPDELEYGGTLQFYNLMRGFKPRPEYPAGEPFFDPLTGEASKFTLTGDPVGGNGWIDGLELPPGDRRVVLTTGPFTMQRGDTVDVVIALVGAVGTNNLSSVSLLKYYDQFAQFSYDNDFQLPSPPPVPSVVASNLDEKVVLNWAGNLNEANAAESFSSGGFRFEGYNVYQLPSATSPLSEAVRIATFDKANDVSFIVEPVFDEVTGFVYDKPVITLPNAGLQRHLVVTQDRIRNRPLANGVDYYFAVTSFSYLPGEDVEAPFRMLESTPVLVTAKPQPEPPGTTEFADPDSSLAISHQGGSTSEPAVEIVDPTLLQSGDYRITFAYYNPYTGQTQASLSEEDTLTTIPENLFEATQYADSFKVGSPFPLRWALERNGTLVSDWLPQIDPAGPVPPSAAPVIDGLKVYVPYVSPGFAGWDFEGTRWITGFTGFGLAQFFGGADIAHNFLGSSLPLDQLETVVMEFQGDSTSGPADGWASRGSVYIRGNGYAFAGIGYLPFAAYAVDSEGNRRQVAVSFVELDDACSNMRWDMSVLTGNETCIADNFREYILIHKRDYDEGVSPGAEYQPFTNLSDLMYAISAIPRGEQPYLEAPFTLTFYAAIANTPGDAFSFSVEGPQTGVTELLEESIDDINVFPNPYLGFSKLESNRFQKFVTFTHLPPRATIRIFTLAGTMVRVIEHDSPTQFRQWDLTNQEGLPVASGVYIVHVDTEHGEKVLKLALVQEEQILERY